MPRRSTPLAACFVAACVPHAGSAETAPRDHAPAGAANPSTRPVPIHVTRCDEVRWEGWNQWRGLDARGRLVERVNVHAAAVESRTLFARDAEGRLLELTQQFAGKRPETTFFRYGAHGELLQVDETRGSRTYTWVGRFAPAEHAELPYGTRGFDAPRVLPPHLGDGSETNPMLPTGFSGTVDVKGELEGVPVDERFDYQRNGRLREWVSNVAGKHSYTFDDAGHLLTAREQVGRVDRTVRHEWRDGRCVGLQILEDGAEDAPARSTFEHDSTGRLTLAVVVRGSERKEEHYAHNVPCPPAITQRP